MANEASSAERGMAESCRARELGRLPIAFVQCEAAATAPTFAILSAAILLSVAVAIEHGRFITEVWRDQRAVDAAVLAASVKLGTPNQDAEGEALAQAFYEANRKDSTPSALGAVTFNNETGEVTAQTQTTWHATLLNALNGFFPGIGDDKPISKRAAVVKGGGSVEVAVAAMQASGNTNIKEGVAWGWRVLSPGLPFTEGRDAGASNNRKIIVLMTDGENMYNSSSNHNKSVYGAHGFAAKGRLGTTYTQSAYTNELNARTRTVCTNAKAAGIIVYTVAFRLENNPTTQALLRDCASGPDNVFTASDGSALVQSFHAIGRDIAYLRLAY